MMFLAHESDAEGIRRFRTPRSVSQADLADEDNPLADALNDDFSQTVLLNLEDTQFLDSTGVAWLMTCEKLFRRHGGAMVLHSLHPHCRQVLDVLKLSTWFSIAADKKEGEQKLQMPPADPSSPDSS